MVVGADEWDRRITLLAGFWMHLSEVRCIEFVMDGGKALRL